MKISKNIHICRKRAYPVFYVLFTLLVFLNQSTEAQTTGGTTAFSILELSNSARTTALGGQQIAFTNDDIAMIGNNPAFINENLNGAINFSTLFLGAGINANNLTYAHKFKNYTSALQLQFVNYGSFDLTDVNANVWGEFYANDFVLNYGSSHQKGKWTFGANAKLLYSVIESYKSTALLADFGTVWHNPKTNTSFGATIKNVGTVLSSYTNLEESEDLPFDIQLAFTKRLEHVPFRFSVNAHSLHQWNIKYDDPNNQEQTSLFGEEEQGKNYFTDEFFRHLIFSGELYLGKPLSIQIAYNHKVRKEMSIQNRMGMLGFSFGVGIHTKKFTFNYGVGVRSLAQSAHHLSFSTNINSWIKRKR